MQIKITIDCNNITFKENTGVELSRILNELAHRMYYVNTDEMKELAKEKCVDKLLDRKGNIVGDFIIE